VAFVFSVVVFVLGIDEAEHPAPKNLMNLTSVG